VILLRTGLRTLVRSEGIGLEPGTRVANPKAMKLVEVPCRGLRAVFALAAEPLYFAGGMG